MSAHNHMHRVQGTHICTPSNTYSFHHKMAALEKKWGCKAPHCTAVVILHFNGTPPSSAPLSPQLVILVSRRLVGSKPPATSSQEDRVTQLQDSISQVRHLQMVTFDCDRLWGGSAGEQEKMGFLLACAPGDEVDCNYATKRKHRVCRGHLSSMSL